MTSQGRVGDLHYEAGQLEVPGRGVKVQEESFGDNETGELEDVITERQKLK